MRDITLPLSDFIRDQRGATAIEYAAIASIISAGLIGAYALLGAASGDVWTTWTNAVQGAVDTSPTS